MITNLKNRGCLFLLILVLAFNAGCSANPKSSMETTETTTAPTAETQTEESVPESESDATTIAAEETELTEAHIAHEIRIGALKGPTAMGMVQLMSQSEEHGNGAENYTFNIAATIDEVGPKLIQGELDIAAIPANMASVLFNNSNGQIQVLTINTLGVLYMVENGDTIQSVEELRGKTIYASGKGATPELVLNYILISNDISPENDVTIEWKSEPTECVAALAQEENAVAMLPQPFVSTAQLQNDEMNIVLDPTEEWGKLQAGADSPSTLITGVTVVRTAFAEENPDAVSAFLDLYQTSTNFVNDDMDGAAALIGEFDIVPEVVAKKALPYCSISFIEGEELKTKLSGYLQVLFEQNPQSIGGELPSDDFYFIR